MTRLASAGVTDDPHPASDGDMQFILHPISCRPSRGQHHHDAGAIPCCGYRHVIMPDMGDIGRRAMYHPLQELSEGERVVIIGTGDMAAIAFEYFRYDTPHKVVAFSA